MTTIDGTTLSTFSQSALDLQNGFCCNSCDTDKLIRWITCKPGVYQSSKTLFSSDDLALCSWYQKVESYSFGTIYLEPGEIAQLDLNCKYVFLKATWPANTYESMKLIEIGLGEQAGYVGMTIPFNIGDPTTFIWRYLVIKELFSFNTEDIMKVPLKFNNISPYTVSISIMHAI